MVKKYNEVDPFSTHSDAEAGLDWMMQNHQINDDLLIQALVQEYYREAFRFAVFRLNDRLVARGLVEDVILKAVSDRHRYWGDASLKSWIFQKVSDACSRRYGSGIESLSPACGRLRHLNPDLVELALLHFDSSLSVQEIAFVQKKNRQEVLHQIDRLYQKLAGEVGFQRLAERQHFSIIEAINRSANGEIEGETRTQMYTHLESCQSCRDYAARVENLRTKIGEDFKADKSLPQISDVELTRVEEEIGERASHERKKRKVSISSKEAMLIGFVIALVAFVGWALSILDDEEPGTSSLAPGPVVAGEIEFPAAGVGELAALPETGGLGQYEGYAYHRLAPIETGVDLLNLNLESFLNDDWWDRYSDALVLESVLHYWNVERNIQDVIKYRYRNRITDVSPAAIVTYVEEKTRLNAVHREEGTIAILHELTEAGFPVIVPTGSNLQGYQYDIVTGFRPFCECLILGSVFVREEADQIEASSFLEDWQAFDYSYIVIYPAWMDDLVRDILGEDALSMKLP